MNPPATGITRAACLLGMLVVLLPLVSACGSSVVSVSPGPAHTPLASPSPTALGDDRARLTDGKGAAELGAEDDFLSLQELMNNERFRWRGQHIRFEHIAEAQGLSSGAVYWITQDRFGFLWIGTSEGLSRYDGHNFQIYKHDPDDPHSLSEDHVFNVLEDHQGNLWVATYGGGLERFDRDRGHFIHYQFDPDDPHSLSHNKVFTIYEDRSGELWVGTSGGGLDRFDREMDGFIHYRHDPDDPSSLASDYVNVIYEDRSGTLWIGTTEGLDKLDRQTGEVVHYQYVPEDPHSLSSDQVFAVLEDHLGNLWVGTSGGGLNRFDRQTEQFTHYRHKPEDPNSLSDDIAFVLLEDQTGTLWIGTLGAGLDRFDRENDQFIHHQNDPGDPQSLSSDYVNAMFEDREGTLWIGTTRRLDKYARQRERFDQFLTFEYVQVILEDQEESVWVGTLDGLYKLDHKLNQVAFYQHDPDDPHSLSKGWVQAIYEDRAGVMWVGVSGGGLVRFDRDTERFTPYRHNPGDPDSLSNDVVNTIYEDRFGVLWVGTDGGLDQFDRERETFRVWPTDVQAPGAARVESIGSILEDGQGGLWVGTWGDGVKRLDRKTGQFVAYRHDSNDPNSLKTNFVSALYRDSVGRMWVGTDGGLHLFDPAEDRFRLYDEEHGMRHDGVGAILEDHNGDLWITTGVGLTQFDPSTGTFTNYDSGDGLQASGYSGAAFRRRSGQMLIGGADAIDIFYPERIQPNPYVPPVALISLQQDGTAVELDQALETVSSVTLSWPRDDLEFEFAALSYSQPDRNQHAYKLEGYDQDWNYIDTGRTGRYTGLPGGTYTLRLKGTNDDGVWNEEGLALRVTIVPPIWETWWFLATVALMLVGSVFAGYRLRVRSIEAQSRELEDQVHERTAELSRTNELLFQEIVERQRAEEALARRAADAAVLEERSRLARELHDAVTQTLFSASLIAETLPDLWAGDPQEGQQLLGELRQLNRGALAEMRTLLLELRPTALIEANLGDLLHQLAEAVIGRTGVPVVVSVDMQCTLPCDVHVALYRIAQEALNNVVKHANAREVQVSLRCIPGAGRPDGEEAVELIIRDDGRGFDPGDVPPHHLGLGIIRERAAAIGAALEIEGRRGHGTRIHVMWSGVPLQESRWPGRTPSLARAEGAIAGGSRGSMAKEEK